MKPRLLSCAAAVLWGLCQAASAQSEPAPLRLMLPGEVLQVDVPVDAPKPPIKLQNTWYTVSLEGNALVLGRSAKSRQPDWTLTEQHNGVPGQTPAEAAAVQPKPALRHAIAMPAGAILAFRPDSPVDGGPPGLKAGRHPSAIAQPVVLHDRWTTSVTSGGQAWTIATESTRRPDGALLAGSMALVGIDPKGQRHLLVPPAHGMAFERQELLWVGSLGPHASPDLLLKRTLITGEIDYVLRVGGALGSVGDDPDHPGTSFSSGIEGYTSTETHVAHKHVTPKGGVPPGRVGLAAFEITEERWNSAVDAAVASGLPQVLFDRQLVVAGEKIRFTVEYLPRLAVQYGEPSSSNEAFWGGPVVVKAHFRGKSQAILQTNRLDGSGFRLQADMVSGQPALQASYYPHYNNSFVHHWGWNAAPGRFSRLLKVHGQGC